MKTFVGLLAGLGIAVSVLSLLGLSASAAQEPRGTGYAVLHTSEGDITLFMYGDEAPLAVGRFINNAERGVYDGTILHDVCPGYMVYGGIVLEDGSFQDAFYGNPPASEADNGLAHQRGSVGTVAYYPDYQSGEFYVTLGPMPYFDGKLTIFAQVVEGMDLIEEAAARLLGAAGPSVVIEDVEVFDRLPS